MILKDIFEDDDSERDLRDITPETAGELFSIFELQPVECDRNSNGLVSGPELKCLNKIWKYFIPNDRLFS